MLEFINLWKLNKDIDKHCEEYRNAEPFQHIVLYQLVLDRKLNELAQAFPQEDWDQWFSYGNEHAPYTRVCEATGVLPLPLRELIYELNSGPFLTFLEELTGIEGLLPDPHLAGGGLHFTTPGGTLTPHTDFHIRKAHPRYRQLNLLLYFTEDWQPENQGCFELWDRQGKKVVKEVEPKLGRAVIFRTNDQSVHGFSKPVAGVNRRSIAMYYYTAEEVDEQYGGNTATYWHTKTIPARDGLDRTRLWAQGFMWQMGRLFGNISWRFQRAALRFNSEHKDSD